MKTTCTIATHATLLIAASLNTTALGSSFSDYMKKQKEQQKSFLKSGKTTQPQNQRNQQQTTSAQKPKTG